MQELPSSSDVAQYGEVHMEIDMILRNDTGRYAWDDVNNMELPWEQFKRRGRRR